MEDDYWWDSASTQEVVKHWQGPKGLVGGKGQNTTS